MVAPRPGFGQRAVAHRELGEMAYALAGEPRYGLECGAGLERGRMERGADG